MKSTTNAAAATKQSLLTIITAADRDSVNPDEVVALLRVLYREIKAGAPIPHAVIRAALGALPLTVAWMDVSYKIDREFEKLGYRYTMPPESADLAALLDAGDYLGIIHFARGSQRDLWAAAMTAHFGPVGTHDSWRNPDGTPNDACRALPEVARRMAAARERCVRLVDWLRYQEERQSQKAA